MFAIALAAAVENFMDAKPCANLGELGSWQLGTCIYVKYHASTQKEKSKPPWWQVLFLQSKPGESWQQRHMHQGLKAGRASPAV